MNTNGQSNDLNQIGERLDFLIFAYNNHTIKCFKFGEDYCQYGLTYKVSATTNKTVERLINFCKTRDILQSQLDDHEMQIAINIFEAILTQEKHGFKFSNYAGFYAIHDLNAPTLSLRFGCVLMTVELPPLQKQVKMA